MILRVVLIKPSKYAPDGFVDRFRRGIMPNSTLPHLRSMTPSEVRGVRVEIHAIDEYVHTDLDYLELLKREPGVRTLVALVGVQSHQLHRAIDLAAAAVEQGCLAVLGGPHVMTCDTSAMHGRGVSFALAEAELIWPAILDDAIEGGLRPCTGPTGDGAGTPTPRSSSPRRAATWAATSFRCSGSTRRAGARSVAISAP